MSCSLGESKTTAVNNVRSYLELEWQAKKVNNPEMYVSKFDLSLRWLGRWTSPRGACEHCGR